MLVDPDAFERSFLAWVRAVFRPEEGALRQVAIDGKAVRRSFDLRKGRSPLHLVSAYATEHGLVLAQRATETKGGELAVLPDLLDGLDLAGCLVSLDALARQPGIAERVTDRGGDYLLALKGNRKKAHAEVRAWFVANAFALGGLLLYRSTVLRHRFALMRPWASGRADRLGPGRVSCIHAAR